PNGQFSESFLPTAGEEPYQIVAGPDGAMWFTEQQINVPPTNEGNKVGRIALDTLAITETPVPTAMSQPTGITLGPDGNLWFTELSSPPPIGPGQGRIGKATPIANGMATI